MSQDILHSLRVENSPFSILNSPFITSLITHNSSLTANLIPQTLRSAYNRQISYKGFWWNIYFC